MHNVETYNGSVLLLVPWAFFTPSSTRRAAFEFVSSFQGTLTRVWFSSSAATDECFSPLFTTLFFFLPDNIGFSLL